MNSRPQLPPASGPVHVLFVLAWLSPPAEAEVEALRTALDPARYLIDVIVCAQKRGARQSAGKRLERIGIGVDRTALHLSFEDTITHLARRLPRYDVVVSCQNVADIYPALERLHWRPPLIEQGTSAEEALAGPKHFTARYVGVDRAVCEAAASRMPGSERVVEIARVSQAPAGLARAEAASRWQRLFAEVLAERKPQAPRPKLFASYFQGGFECSTHKLNSGRRLDLIAATGHDRNAARDYRQLQEHGMRTVRDGFRWHLIEQRPGAFDWSSVLPMLRAARAAGSQVIWDLLHYGVPDGIDIWRPDFIRRFARFAAAAARLVRDETDAVPFYCPVNEMSFHSWGGGDAGYLNPFGTGRGFELKVQLARASIAAMDEVLAVDSRARFVHCEPLINIVRAPGRAVDHATAEGHHQAQFQACDMIAGLMWPQLGGDPRYLDIVGINYYHNNQWIHGGRPVDIGHPLYRPLRHLLLEVHARYGRPVLIAETGIEAERRPGWLRYVCEEARAARNSGVALEGICLYPILEHPGWDNDRDCPNGLFSCTVENGRRRAYLPLANELALQQRLEAGATADTAQQGLRSVA